MVFGWVYKDSELGGHRIYFGLMGGAMEEGLMI